MSDLAHRIYITTLSGIVILTTIFLAFKGYPYYSTPLEERFYHPDHDLFKPSGILGHGLGIVGTLLILFGVFSYIARKRYRSLARLGRLKYWLEFHIFLCSLGPVMVLFHTAFKFGGIVSVSFWSMVAVVLSGVIGRFIYIRIPRTIEGRELNLVELQEMKSGAEDLLKNTFDEADPLYQDIRHSMSGRQVEFKSNLLVRILQKSFQDKRNLSRLRRSLRQKQQSQEQIKRVVKLVKNEISLNNRIQQLQVMRRLFKYWHVAHLPFAMIMLIIMVIHVAVTLVFGYRWIF